jgi:PIN domain nuclease of toxin-antitoxin system
VKVLLDTLILVWWLADDPRLPSAVVDIIADRDTDVFVSAATAWEISIKRAAGRLEAPDDFLDAVAANEFVTLAIFGRTRHGCRAAATSSRRSLRPDAVSPSPGRKPLPSSVSTLGSPNTKSTSCP